MTVGGMGFIPERLLMMMMMMIPVYGTANFILLIYCYCQCACILPVYVCTYQCTYALLLIDTSRRVHVDRQIDE